MLSKEKMNKVKDVKHRYSPVIILRCILSLDQNVAGAGADPRPSRLVSSVLHSS